MDSASPEEEAEGRAWELDTQGFRVGVYPSGTRNPKAQAWLTSLKPSCQKKQT